MPMLEMPSFVFAFSPFDVLGMIFWGLLIILSALALLAAGLYALWRTLCSRLSGKGNLHG